MYVRTPSDLGSAIREQRRRHKISQQKLADDVGVSRQWLVEVERGKPRAELVLVLKPPPPDIDAIVARARKRRP